MNSFFFEGELFHRLNQIKDCSHYLMKLGNREFKLNQVQLIFLSLNAFDHFLSSNQPFEIPISFNSPLFKNLSLNTLQACFDDLISLFYSKTEIELTTTNVIYFKYLAEVLDNPWLRSRCSKVSLSKSQIFHFSSKQLERVPQTTRSLFNDFCLVVNGEQFQVNSSLFSCVSDLFLQMNKQENTIRCSISDESFLCFLSFLDVFKGISFNYQNFELQSVFHLIDCFGLSSLGKLISSHEKLPEDLSGAISFLSKNHSLHDYLNEHFNRSISIIVENIENISIDQLNTFLLFQLYSIFSLSQLQISNEDFLFSLIIQLIQLNPS
jgi:hypothetical protein